MKKLMSIIVLVLITTSAIAQLTLQDMPYFRPYDKRGLSVFETPKVDTIPFDGVKVRLGGAFTQQFQGLRHSNTAQARFANNDPNTPNLNQLMEIGNGFNLAMANLNLDVLLADGIRLNLVTYLSSRHHPEAWVKGGFLQVDKLTFLNSPLVDRIMEKVTLKVGHMEINYGDAHFRRSDGGNAMHNPFVENYVMDAFTTEIGSEIYFQHKGFIAMAAVTGGEIQGSIIRPDDRKPSVYGKLGYDRQLNDFTRVRLTGSFYKTNGSINNTLYGGDRTGARYHSVMTNVPASFTGRLNPAFGSEVSAFVINPFIKVYGIELFGNFEQASGRRTDMDGDKPAYRTWNQFGADAIYRIGRNENFYIAARYNKVSGDLGNPQARAPFAEVSIDRIQFGGGWFVTRNILAKLEYVNQNYNGFAPTDIRNGGKFNGFMLEGVIAF
jgi:hypothetical protein